MNYIHSEIFKGITEDEYKSMLHCFKPVRKNFKAGELIYDYGNGMDCIGIVQNGAVAIVRIDKNGNRDILESITENSVFGDVLSFYNSNDDVVYAVCVNDCEVMFIDFCHITKRCRNACKHHSILVENMLELIARRAKDLSMRIQVLSQRSTKDKLICYFKILAGDKFKFTLPYSLSALADYLSVDRSAMMREIKKLKEKNIIEQKGREIKIKNLQL